MAKGVNIDNGRYWDESINPLKALWKIEDKHPVMKGYHCTKNSPACKYCWAEAYNIFRGNGVAYEKNDDIYLECDEKVISKFYSSAKNDRIFFLCDLTDIAHEKVTQNTFNKIMGAILFNAMANGNKRKYLILTKRIDRLFDMAAKFVAGLNHGNIIKFLNCTYWGVTICNQREADIKLKWLTSFKGYSHLFKTWVSLEPLLEEVDIDDCLKQKTINQVIAGFESGPKARPGHPMWAAKMAVDCNYHNVPFFFKQWGKWKPIAGYYDNNIGEITDQFFKRELLIIERNGNIHSRLNGGHAQISRYQPENDAQVMLKTKNKKEAGRCLDGIYFNKLIWRE